MICPHTQVRGIQTNYLVGQPDWLATGTCHFKKQARKQGSRFCWAGLQWAMCNLDNLGCSELC
jgi:hypothetical protein